MVPCFRVVNLAVESRRSPSRVMESTKSSAAGPPSNSWNRGPSDLQYAQPRSFYHPATVPSALPPPPPPPPLSAPNMWPPRQPTFGDLMSLSAIPPQWHQDPAAMAWIASRHMMLPLAGHPHNYPVQHGHAHTANGALQQQQPRLYSPTTSSSANPVANEDVVFPCELCGKSFTAKETLRQVYLLPTTLSLILDQIRIFIFVAYVGSRPAAAVRLRILRCGIHHPKAT